ncbi:MAG: ROK family transcriptional regulator [Oscillibacter sp.]|nr:ROK family transcriptional regulator [Oscillibacter sp.]
MKISPASNMDVKRRNRANTLRCILSCERISQMELSQQLALSWPTILQNVKELLEMGLVQEVGQYESTGGRKARAYAPVKDARLAIGLDLTRNHASVVLVDLSGQVVRYQRRSRPFSLDDAYLQELGMMTQSIMEGACTGEAILGAGISLPGIVDSEAGILRYSHILNLRDVPLSTLSRHIPYPCGFINDANAAGLAEVYGISAAENLIYLSLSNSVGGAILTDGALYMGNHLRAGEFGHNTLVPGGRRCYCGKDGCLDAYCSARLISEQADGNLAAFFDSLREGDAEKQAVWQEYLEYLAIAVNNLHMSFDCDVIAGGYIGAFLEEFGGPLLPLLEARNTFQPDASYLKFCRYKLEASAVGAAVIQVERFLQSF